MSRQNWHDSCSEGHIIYALQHVFHYVHKTLC
jgi:hypothetical protein